MYVCIVTSASKQNCLSSHSKTATEDFVHGQVLILATAIARTWQGSHSFSRALLFNAITFLLIVTLLFLFHFHAN